MVQRIRCINMHMKKHVAKHFLMRSKKDVPAISQHAIVMLQKQKEELGWIAEKGVEEMWPTPGDGKAIIQTDTKDQ